MSKCDFPGFLLRSDAASGWIQMRGEMLSTPAPAVTRTAVVAGLETPLWTRNCCKSSRDLYPPFPTSDPQALLPKSPFFYSHLLAGEVLLLLPVASATCDTPGGRNNPDEAADADGEHLGGKKATFESCIEKN